jgi:hypothetical protein
VRAALTKQGGERSIAERLRNRKALDLIVENARVTDEEWREETTEELGAVESTDATDEAPLDQPTNEAEGEAERDAPSSKTESQAPEV